MLITIDLLERITEDANRRIEAKWRDVYSEEQRQYRVLPTVSVGMARAVLEAANDLLDIKDKESTHG